VLVDKPDYKGRLEILKIHSKGVKLADDVSLEEIARMTAGLVGADLANIVNEAALLAGRKGKERVEQEDLVEAVERQLTGLEKKSRRLSEKEKKIVAYHELGHAVVAEAIPEAPKVKKISIIPRGLAALGYTLHMPEEDKFLYQKKELLAEVDVLLGGRAAEELFIGDISTGAGNDLERANDIVRAMVGMYGMSEVAGLMVLEKQQGAFLGGRRITGDHSEALQEEIDRFIKKVLEERYKRVKEILIQYRPVIEQLKEELFFDEVIEGSRLREVMEAFKNGKLEEEIAKFQKRKEERERSRQKSVASDNEEGKGKAQTSEEESGEGEKKGGSNGEGNSNSANTPPSPSEETTTPSNITPSDSLSTDTPPKGEG
jgi:cell division protease FtsH